MASGQGLGIVPANEASAGQLDAVFGTRGEGANCRCQRYRLQPRESFGGAPASLRAERQRRQAHCGDAASPVTSGLVAFLDGEPAGWCAVEPQSNYPGLLRVYRVPWTGRDEDKSDGGVWAVTCLFTRAGFRRRGVARELARAAVPFACSRGARALEAYPMRVEPGVEVPWGEVHVGTQRIFEAAGLSVVSQPTPRRVVMRVDFASPA